MGYCATTLEAEGDCERGSSGSWVLEASVTSWLTAEAYCQGLCARCSQCRFISFSPSARDCSWFSVCNLSSTVTSGGGGKAFRSARTWQHHSSGPRAEERVLSSTQRLPTATWASRLDPARSFVLQIGANDHSEAGYLHHRSGLSNQGKDPCPWIISQLGWEALLLEPNPPVWRRLRDRYVDNRRVRTLNALLASRTVCHTESATLGSSRGQATFWAVDMSNATGMWGSDDAEARCADQGSTISWVQEIASLSKGYLTRLHAPALRRTPEVCERCSVRLNRMMSPHCVRKLIHAATRELQVPCAQLRHELALRARQVSNQRTHSSGGVGQVVTLLFIDAEGHDHEVLLEYPFDVFPPQRVVFEAVNIGRANFEVAAAHLRAHGYRFVTGGLGWPHSVWHHLNATQGN